MIGSRKGVNLDVVREYVETMCAKHPETILISGGARGVDSVAENVALRLGHLVVSLRPFEVTGGYRIRRLMMHRDHAPISSPGAEHYGFFGTFAEAAKARNTFIVEHATIVVAFTAGTPGTAHAISEARRLDTPFHLYDSQGGTL